MVCARFFQSLDQVIVLGAGTSDAEGIGLLESVAANQFGRNLAGDGDHGDGIHQGVHQARWSGSWRRDRRWRSTPPPCPSRARNPPPANARIFLVAHQDVTQGVVVEDIVQTEW